ncbi:MAG: PAS domain S-box protein [Bacteroidota bacterium]
MNEQNKTREGLLNDLRKLRQEYDDLKTLYETDISERKLSQKKFRDNEAKFQSLFMNMSEGSSLHELSYNDRGVAEDYIIIETNPAFEMILGMARENVIGKTSREAYGVDEPPYFEIYKQVAITGEPIAFETYFPPLAKHFSISVYCPYKGGFATIFEDITERKRIEQDLRVSLSKYKVLFDSSPVGITISDSRGQIIESNHLAKNLLGLSSEEQEKRSIIGEEWRIVRPDGTPMPASEFASVRALKEQRHIENVEMGIVKSQNQITWINVSAAPIPMEGYGVTITYHDISARKLAEESLRQTNDYLENLINYANAPIIVWDPQFRITRFNHAFEFLTGLNEAEVIGQSLEILFPPSLIEDSLMLIRKTLTGERWETVEIKIQHIDGSVRTVLWNSATLFNPDGITPIATIAQGKDITARKQTEAELNLKNEELLKTIAEKDKFFSIIAHDLRSPISSFLGLSQIMAEELHTLTLDQIQNIAVKMRKSASNLYELLENLLTWSLLQRGITTFEPSSFLLISKISESVQLISESAHPKEISINVEIPEDLEIYADENMFATVIRNLISNAVKFTPKYGKINISAKSSNDNMIQISVNDTGIGMSKILIANLFRLDENTNRKGTDGELSTGLGLLICKDFVERHGGNLWVESEEGKGSTFYFTVSKASSACLPL